MSGPSKLPRSVVRGRRIVIGLLVVSSAAGFCAVVAVLMVLVPLLWEALP